MTHHQIAVFASESECVALREFVNHYQARLNLHIGEEGPAIDQSYDKAPKFMLPVLNDMRKRTLKVVSKVTQTPDLKIQYSVLTMRPRGIGQGFHKDNMKHMGDVCMSRCVTSVLALNSLQQGRSLLFDAHNDYQQFPHTTGRLLFFDSGLWHSVQTPETERYAMLMWFTTDPDFEEKHRKHPK